MTRVRRCSSSKPVSPTEEKAIAQWRSALSRYPFISRLVGRDIAPLAQIYLQGNRLAEAHPLVALVLSDEMHRRAMQLESGLATLHLNAETREFFRGRIVHGEIRAAHAAVAELHAAGLIACAGARVSIVLPKGSQGRTPDIDATYRGHAFTLEVKCIQRSESDVGEDNARKEAFADWRPAGRSVPKVIKGKGEASEFIGVRMLHYMVNPLGTGGAPKQIGRLTDKKGTRQLRGKPTPLLIMSLWHAWGIDREMCRPTYKIRNHGTHTGVLFAATYGRRGDVVYYGDESSGLPRDVGPQPRDGILHSSRSLAGVVWLFYNGDGVVLENTRDDAGKIPVPLRPFLLRAFKARNSESRIVATTT